MAPAEPQVVPNVERRRSERQALALPLLVRGTALDAKAFQEETFTLSVSAHGALVAMATTVTLGQTLFLKNPQTQEEAGAWVTRLAPPRCGWAQVGVEFVQANADFWSNKPHENPPTDVAERRIEGAIHVLPHPEERGVSADSSVEIPKSQTPSSDILLHALDQTLRQAAEQAVATAATARLGAAVNQVAATIENFGRARMGQLEERLMQYQQELVTSARKDFVAEIQANVTRTEEHLRKLAEDLIGDAARKEYGDFAERLREAANQSAVQFIEDSKTSSTRHAVRLAEQIQAVTNDARTQIEVTAAGLSQSQDRAKDEMERAVAETRQIVQSLTSQIKETCAEWESRLRRLQEEFAVSKEQEVEHFRERLRSVLTTLLSSLK